MPEQRPFPFYEQLPSTVHLPRGKGRNVENRAEDVRSAYDEWKRRYLAETDDGEYRVRFSAKPESKTVSEGQGYGMLIVAYMAGYDREARRLFEGLYRFSRRYPSSIDPVLMDWEVHFDGTPNQRDDSAFDGDADIAYALLLAERQWGREPGVIRFGDEARRIIRRIATSTLGKESHLPLLGDWVSPDKTTGEHNQWTWRASDFLPAHFRAYGKATGDSVWRETIRQGYAQFAQLQKRFSPKTGLLPDFIVARSADTSGPIPAPADFLEGKYDGDYYYNACRIPWRLGMDVLHYNAAEACDCLGRLMRWAISEIKSGPIPFAPGYYLDGSPILKRDKQYLSTAFVAPLALGAATGNAPQEYVDTLYDTIRSEHEGYYEDTITLLCLIALSGAAWKPA